MKLLLSGYYGFGNIGDEAILAGILTSLKGRHEITVLSNDPRSTSYLHKVKAVHRYLGALKALFECDVLISGGGGLLQDATSRRSLIYYLGLIRWARKLGKRTIIFGQSLGPLSNQGLKAIQRELRGIPTAVRDIQSRKLLADLGIHAELTADSALLLFNPLLKSIARPSSQISPILLVPRGGHSDLTEVLAAVGSKLAADGIPLATLALHSKQDTPEVVLLREQVPNLALWSANNHWEALNKISSAGFIISTRLHGLILAAVANRGFAGLVYDPKVAGFLSEAGAPAFHRPIDLDSLLLLAHNRPKPLPENLSTLTQRAHAGIRWLEKMISAPSTTRGDKGPSIVP
ncbi:MAG: polysaccharide pyruvyl transferase CsaB [Deinococcales bacterium]|jgi:polysaccharide pyruvyl transferase CsaB|nr:polysaccharide pyruvyl transferase CsaB [Deinococcales bacterium]